MVAVGEVVLAIAGVIALATAVCAAGGADCEGNWGNEPPAATNRNKTTGVARTVPTRPAAVATAASGARGSSGELACRLAISTMRMIAATKKASQSVIPTSIIKTELCVKNPMITVSTRAAAGGKLARRQ
jgi:hypothetical protein